MSDKNEVTRQDVIELLKRHGYTNEMILITLDTPLPHLGDKTANDWGNGGVKNGWLDVLSVFRRMYE